MNKLVLLAVVIACGCEQDGRLTDVSTDECVSGLRWVGGNEGSPSMRPGHDCIGCHTREGEGPRFLVAGTVYESVDEPDDCAGLAGVTVEITDADGIAWTLLTNDAGNFYVEAEDGPMAFPFQAALVIDGTKVPMATQQSDGACATCHTQTGANQAVGRIFVP